ncbi:MAG: carbon storage regulator [Thermoguttaceae bacterium]|jgi:carbon storage regulator CsrA
MLVLSRKIGEEIVFPASSVSIVVLAVHGKRVQLGIEAPPEEPVYRAELWQRKRQASDSCRELLAKT